MSRVGRAADTSSHPAVSRGSAEVLSADVRGVSRAVGDWASGSRASTELHRAGWGRINREPAINPTPKTAPAV